ncbi:MAG: DUF91 domain-containing protein [bacterium]|nr:DUF91 domain-containing protein [bacterium]
MMVDKLEYFKIATKLNKEREKDLRTKKLHFRGNINSFSLISLDRETPERGISQLKTEKRGNKALDEKIDEILEEIKYAKATDCNKTRITREKELQAWIIDYALNHKKHLLPFGDGIEFLTSELAIKQGKKRVVNDILGIDKHKNLVVIELKSDRNKTTLEKQVNKFSELIKADKSNFFVDLVSLLAGRKWSGNTKGMIVWPNAYTSPLEKWEHGIVEICYEEIKGNDGKKVIDYDEAGNIQFFPKKT